MKGLKSFHMNIRLILQLSRKQRMSASYTQTMIDIKKCKKKNSFLFFSSLFSLTDLSSDGSFAVETVRVCLLFCTLDKFLCNAAL